MSGQVVVPRAAPLVWSLPWRGHLWHARAVLVRAGPSVVFEPGAACGFRPARWEMTLARMPALPCPRCVRALDRLAGRR